MLTRRGVPPLSEHVVEPGLDALTERRIQVVRDLGAARSGPWRDVRPDVRASVATYPDQVAPGVGPLEDDIHDIDANDPGIPTTTELRAR